MEHGTENTVGAWSVPQCPFRIEYSMRVLDDIRLAVVDAFFSLPRGGAEIGGILLGQWHGDWVSIVGFEPLDCEHASGPSFNLSPRDQALLAEMTAAARRNPPSRQPVGWYHSHTRSEIFLSEADQEIHNRFFPKSWQIALVLKPHTFEPTRAGFFFREAGGAIHGEASYREFRLDPLPLRGEVANGTTAYEPSLERQVPHAASVRTGSTRTSARPKQRQSADHPRDRSGATGGQGERQLGTARDSRIRCSRLWTIHSQAVVARIQGSGDSRCRDSRGRYSVPNAAILAAQHLCEQSRGVAQTASGLTFPRRCR